MEFVLLAAIFLASTGLLVSATVAPTTPATTAPLTVPGPKVDRMAAPQSGPDLPGRPGASPAGNSERSDNPTHGVQYGSP